MLQNNTKWRNKDGSFNSNSSYSIDFMLMQILGERLKEDWGKKPLCNGRPERAPHIGTFCFPICWRCLGISCGIIIVTVAYYLNLFAIVKRHFSILAFVGVIPCLVDYWLQHSTHYLSNNFKRFFFGIMAGVSVRIICFEIMGA